MSTHALTERYLAEDVYEDVLWMRKGLLTAATLRSWACSRTTIASRWRSASPTARRVLGGKGAPRIGLRSRFWAWPRVWAPEMPLGTLWRGVCGCCEAVELLALATLRGRELLLKQLEAWRPKKMRSPPVPLLRQVGAALAPPPGAHAGR